VKAATAMETPSVVVPVAPVLVNAIPIHTLASAPIVRLETDFPRKRYCRRATQGVVIIFANLLKPLVESKITGGERALLIKPN